MSDSLIRTNPSIEDPSNIILLFKIFVNCSCVAGTSTFFNVPKISVNIKRKNVTFFSLTSLKISVVVVTIWYLLYSIYSLLAAYKKSVYHDKHLFTVSLIYQNLP